MSGTKSGGILTRDSIYKTYGRDYYVKLGAKGGSVRGPKGFALMSRKKRSAAGAKGGRISRRGPKT